MMKRAIWLLGLGVLLLTTVASAAPQCEMAWNAPTTYADGAPLDRPIDWYHVYVAKDASLGAPVMYIVPGAVVTATVDCPGWTWVYATAVICASPAEHLDCLESDGSNVEVVKKPSGPPENVHQGK